LLLSVAKDGLAKASEAAPQTSEGYPAVIALGPPASLREALRARCRTAGFSGLAESLKGKTIAMANAYMPE
jgi:hypothetical protein